MVGSALIARFSCGTYSPAGLRVYQRALLNSQISTPKAALCHRRRDQMLLDRLQSRIDDRTAVEGADRQHDHKRLDQKAHADSGPTGDDREADSGLVQPAHGRLGAVGQDLVLGEEGAVDVGYHERDTCHWETRFN